MAKLKKASNKLPRATLKELSKSDADKNNVVYPLKGKMQFVDFDGSGKELSNRGWINIFNKGAPNTTDTIMFKGDEIIPVEIKSRTKEKPASKNIKKRTVLSLAKKLSTFVANIHRLHNIKILEYWMITDFFEDDNISVGVKEKALSLVDEAKYIKNKSEIKSIISSVKISQMTPTDIKPKKLQGLNKLPKWFIKYYESDIKAKNAKKVDKVVAKKEGKAKVASKTTQSKNKANDLLKIKISSQEFLEYKNKQEKFHKSLVQSINLLTKEIKNLRADSNEQEFVIKRKTK